MWYRGILGAEKEWPFCVELRGGVELRSTRKYIKTFSRESERLAREAAAVRAAVPIQSSAYQPRPYYAPY